MSVKPAKHHEEHVLIVFDGKGQKEIILDQTSYSLGRGQDCDIRIQSQFVSRHHATLIKQSHNDIEEYYRIIDGDLKGNTSVNGLLVNERKVLFHDLKNGDKVVFGPQVSAIYEHRQYDVFPTLPPDDPFDITLIDPAMILVEEEEEIT